MGQYMGLRLQLERKGLASNALAPLFSGPFFMPIAAAGIVVGPTGERWLLAGYALEDFLERFRTSRPSLPSDIALLPSPRNDNREYLEVTRRSLLEGVTPPLLSPFEHADLTAGVTYLDALSLGADALQEIDWAMSGLAGSVLYLYGSIDVAVRGSVDLPWRRAFRQLSRSRQTPIPGDPLLLFRVGPSPFCGDRLDLLAFSRSRIWLRDAHSLNGRVGAQEADRNLERLADVIAELCKAGATRLLTFELDLEGRPFLEETRRLNDAFRRLKDVS